MKYGINTHIFFLLKIALCLNNSLLMCRILKPYGTEKRNKIKTKKKKKKKNQKKYWFLNYSFSFCETGKKVVIKKVEL